MDCSSEILDGFRQPALVRTSNAHDHQAIVEIGVDLQRLLKMRRGLIVSAAHGQGHAQIVFYAEIGWSDCERVLKQSEAVMPALNLSVREGSKNQQNDARYCCTEPRRNASPLRDVR